MMTQILDPIPMEDTPWEASKKEKHGVWQERTGVINAVERLGRIERSAVFQTRRTSAPVLGPGALDRLVAYPWPGNVREIENSVERALILSKGHPLSFDDLEGPAVSSGPLHRDSVPAGMHPGETLALDAFLSDHIQRVLAMTGGKVGGKKGAAELLEVNPSTLRKKMRKLGIPFGRKAGSSREQKVPRG